MHRFPQFNRNSDDTLDKVVYDDLMSTSKAYSLFCADLSNCRKIVFTVVDVNDANHMFIILCLRAFPMCVYDSDLGTYASFFNISTSDADEITIKNLKSATVTSLLAISEYIKTLYGPRGNVPVPYSTTSGIIYNAASSTDTTRDFWNKNKHRLYEWYRDSEIPVYELPMAPMVDNLMPNERNMKNPDALGYQGPINDIIEEDSVPVTIDQTLSEQTWSELRGYYTGYIDNLGVFCPDAFKMDKTLSNSYYSKIGDPFLDYFAVRMIMNAGEQQNAETWQLIFGWVPGLGQLDDVYQTSVEKRKYIMPRVAAFDRQTRKVPPYDNYVAVSKSLGHKEANDWTWNPQQKWYFKYQKWYDILYPLFKTRSVALRFAPDEIKNDIMREEGIKNDED